MRRGAIDLTPGRSARDAYLDAADAGEVRLCVITGGKRELPHKTSGVANADAGVGTYGRRTATRVAPAGGTTPGGSKTGEAPWLGTRLGPIWIVNA
jgi:hypothetical protein